MNLFRTVCAKSGFEMETAGCLAGGSRVWALAKMSEGACVVDKDEVRPYLLMATSFDGTLATTAKLTAVRVVCQNTLSISTLNDSAETDKNTVKVYHSQNWDQDAAIEQLGIYTSSWQKFMLNTKRMADRTLTPEEVDAVLCTTFGKPSEGEKADNFRKGPVYQNVVRLFNRDSIGNDGSGTAWQLLNAVTEQVDHHAGRSVDTRLNSAWFGQGNTVKQKAYKALELLAA
jgi:phage/plasmid-like protein (TIGR03299 family)